MPIYPTANKNGTTSYVVRVRRQGLPAINKSFSSIKEAQAYESEVLNAIFKGKRVVTKQVLKAKIGEVISQYQALGLVLNEAEGYRLALLQEHLSELSVEYFTVEVLQKYLTKHPYNISRAQATVRKNYFTLKKVLEWFAEKNKVELPHALFKNRTVKVPHSGNQRERLWTQQDFAQIFKGADKHLYKHKVQFKLVLIFLSNTALRLNECLNFTYANVNFENRTLAIHKDLTKTNQYKVVPLTSTAHKVLVYMKKYFMSNSGDKVFGCFKNSNQFGLKFRQLVSKINRDLVENGFASIDDLHIHDLRHTATTNFYKKTKLTDLQIASITGHSELRTLKRYTHLRPSDLIDKLW